MCKPLRHYDEEYFEEYSARIYWRRHTGALSHPNFLFLDRDGVINYDSGYVGRTADVRLLPGVRDAVHYCRSQGIRLGLITNQSGIGRGYYSWSDFESVCNHIGALISDEPVFEAIAACSVVPDHDILENADWRKPQPGMIKAVARRLNICLEKSWMVGDRISDIEAAWRAGLAGAIQVADISEPHFAAKEGFFVGRNGRASNAILDAASKILRSTRQ